MAFGDVTIDVASRRVRAPNGASDLEPRTFDLLMTLAERPGLTASRDHLIETVWSPDEGSQGALNKAVTDLRKALGDEGVAPRFIETVPAIGYRWIYEDAPGAPTASRWSLGPSWVAAGAALAIAVGGAGGVAAYAWTQGSEPDGFEIRKSRMQRQADGRCVEERQIIRGVGVPSAAQNALPRPSSAGCAPLNEPRSFVQR